jgi:carboxyl-terminal processing protease
MIRISHALTAGFLAVLLVGIAGFYAGWNSAQAMGNVPLATVISSLNGDPTSRNESGDLQARFSLFWDVWGLVQKEYYHTEPLDQQQMVYGAIRGMLASLGDQYTTFQEPADAASSRESLEGRFEGIGAYLKVEGGSAVIERPIRQSPAEKAGLQSGDVIVAIDDTPITAIVAGLDDAAASSAVVSRIRGPQGSVVVLSIERTGEAVPFDVSITRDEVPLISVNAEMLDGGIAYVQITEFKAPTTEELDAALAQLLPQQPRAIILDLRNNPGGFLDTAREVLGRFYSGVALYEEDSTGNLLELATIDAPDQLRAYDVPLAVLINGASASAAEIVAGALREQRPGTLLIGETSFGKGSVQNIHQLRDGSSVRITIAHWLTPQQQAIHQVGIIPDRPVSASQDPQYQVPCVVENQPPEGRQYCSDAQFAAGLQHFQP